MSKAPAASTSVTDRRGYLPGIGCYVIWGFLPLYFHALASVDPFELVAHRIIWSLGFLAILIPLAGQASALRAALRQPRTLAALATSALLIAANWIVYVWAVATGHVVAASLGYFLNPLVNVAIGVLLLGERLSRGQATALAIAGVGIAFLAWGEISTLWVSLSLAITFAFYGYIRKQVAVPAMTGLAIETMVLLPVALAVIAFALTSGASALDQPPAIIALVACSGVVTSVPLILFAAAARHLSMTALGLLQYAAPTIQFIIGIGFLHEHVSPARWASFSLIWLGLALFVWDTLGRARKTRAMAETMAA